MSVTSAARLRSNSVGGGGASTDAFVGGMELGHSPLRIFVISWSNSVNMIESLTEKQKIAE